MQYDGLSGLTEVPCMHGFNRYPRIEDMVRSRCDNASENKCIHAVCSEALITQHLQVAKATLCWIDLWQR